MALHPAIDKYFANFYNWRDTTNRQPTPGAEAFAFATQTLPLYDWKGPGEIVRDQLMTYSPQVYVTQQVVPTGIAGIAAGQSVMAALQDNMNQSG